MQYINQIIILLVQYNKLMPALIITSPAHVTQIAKSYESKIPPVNIVIKKIYKDR